MSEQESEWQEDTSGSFADLGLESPDVPLPSYGVGVGIHKGFVSNMRFLTKDGRRSLVLTYKVVQQGSKFNGQTRDEWKDANEDDSLDKKKYLKGRLVDLGVKPEEIKNVNIKELIGTPVYFEVRENKSNKDGKFYMNIWKVELDTDGEFDASQKTEAPVSGGRHSVAAEAVSASEINY